MENHRGKRPFSKMPLNICHMERCRVGFPSDGVRLIEASRPGASSSAMVKVSAKSACASRCSRSSQRVVLTLACWEKHAKRFNAATAHPARCESIPWSTTRASTDQGIILPITLKTSLAHWSMKDKNQPPQHRPSRDGGQPAQQIRSNP